jgi:hypothetical protein
LFYDLILSCIRCVSINIAIKIVTQKIHTDRFMIGNCTDKPVIIFDAITIYSPTFASSTLFHPRRWHFSKFKTRLQITHIPR